MCVINHPVKYKRYKNVHVYKFKSENRKKMSSVLCAEMLEVCPLRVLTDRFQLNLTALISANRVPLV